MKAYRSTSCFTTLAVVVVLLVSTPAVAQYSFDWDITWQGAVKDMLILEDFMTHLTNTSAATDSFEVTLATDMPPFWQATICEGPVCYPPSVTVHKFILDPGASTNLDFAITAALDEGQGSSIVTVRSLSNPAVFETNTFTIVTTGLDVLIVNASGNPAYPLYYNEALDIPGYTHGVWDRGLLGSLAAADMTTFDAVIWFVGTNSPGLDATDRASLLDYVKGGGSLFMSGQNLVRDFCSTASPYYTPESRAWFGELLEVDFQGDDAPGNLVYGTPDDPVANGLALTINGGDGADNNISPDAVSCLSQGVVSLTYTDGSNAAVRTAYHEGRTFFTAFAWEGIASASQREILMTGALDWMITRVSAVGGDVQPILAGPPEVFPNPFNPQTSINFEVGGEQPVPSEVVIYDLTGRAVRHLFSGTVEPGPHRLVWNGRDNMGRSLSSGLYLARVTVAENSRTVKMTLAR